MNMKYNKVYRKKPGMVMRVYLMYLITFFKKMFEKLTMKFTTKDKENF